MTPLAFYAGDVMHARLRPREHRFRYRVFMALLDLESPSPAPSRLRWFSSDRFNLMSVRQRDYLPDRVGDDLLARARHAFASFGVDVEGARVLLMTMPRVAGYAFNPISVYYAVDGEGALRGALYEVRNTFGERVVYEAGAGPGEALGPHETEKALHVSPFLPMGLRYRFRLAPPAERANLTIVESDAEGVVLTALFSGGRVEASDANILRLFFSLPFMTLKVILAIHFEALRLFLKGFQVHRHPRKTQDCGDERRSVTRSDAGVSEA